MPDEKLLSAKRCVLLVIDIQEAFSDHIPNLKQVIERSRVMVEAAKLLEIPIVVTEQYPKGLGLTVGPLREALGERTFFDKVTFSCLRDEKIEQAVLSYKRDQLLMVGIETHVCVAQTTYDALSLSLQPFLASDATASRRENDGQIALDRMRESGVIITTTEAAIMEMTVSSRHPAFRKISKLIK